MTDQYLGEIRAFGFNFAPMNWAQCNGQIAPISQYTALFSLLGTNFGGNGTNNFGLPDLQGRVPMHWGNGPGLSPYVLGETTGSPAVTLTLPQISVHTHNIQVAEAPRGSTDATPTPSPSAWLGLSAPAKAYVATGNPNVQLNVNAIGVAGSSQPHENRQPYLTLNFCIALSGIYPPRS